MLAQFIMKSGQAVIANVEKVKITKNGMGEIVSVEWSTPEDAYSELRYIKVSDIVAVVMIRNESTKGGRTYGNTPCNKCGHIREEHGDSGCLHELGDSFCSCDRSTPNVDLPC